MTAEGWKEAVFKVVREYESGDPTGVDLLALLLEDQDRAKQALRNKGYGWIGTNWDEMVELVPVGLR